MSFPRIPNITPFISVTTEQTVPLLLASIAFEELALAHVINADAEKLQFVLGTIEDSAGVTFSPPVVSLSNLLDVNKSVQRTLRDVIKKEMLLEFKFENILDLIDTLPPACNPTIGAQFSNTGAITNIDGGTGTSPYPSDIVVSGLQGSISKVTVTIRDFVEPDATSPAPGHQSLLVVSPNGTAVLISSDAGNSSSGAFGPVTFTIDDNAPTLIPQTPFVSGTYKPSVYTNNYNFDPPAPQGFPYNTALSSFIGENPNGTWNLFAFDRFGGHGQAINGGWTLTINTDCP